MAERHPSIGDVRGLGVFWAVELVKNRETREPLVPFNAAGPAETVAAAVRELVGAEALSTDKPPAMGSEDFSFMLERVPGAYLNVGNGEGLPLHHPGYAFNDAAIPYGAALFARVVERELPRGGMG